MDIKAASELMELGRHHLAAGDENIVRAVNRADVGVSRVARGALCPGFNRQQVPPKNWHRDVI